MPSLRYPSDLSHEEWKILEPLLASPEKRNCRQRWPITTACNDIGSASMNTFSMRSVWATYTQIGIEGQSANRSLGPDINNWWYSP